MCDSVFVSVCHLSNYYRLPVEWSILQQGSLYTETWLQGMHITL